MNPEQLSAALSLTFHADDLNQDITVAGYLCRLLRDLWAKTEEFNSKRPFGNSGWTWDLYIPLMENGFIPGEYDDEDEYWEFDEPQAEAFVLALIDHLFALAQAQAGAGSEGQGEGA